MTLQDLLKNLAMTTLASWAGVEQKDFSIKEKFKPVAISSVNEALIKLYSEFVIKENAVYLCYQEGKTNYDISPAHLCGEREEPSYKKYLISVKEAPYKDDLLKLLSIYSVTGERIPLNNSGNPASAFTPVYNRVQIPCGYDKEIFCLNYQAKHPTVKADEDVIEIPEQLLALLQNYIGYLVYSRVNTAEAINMSMQYLQAYASGKQLVDSMDLVNQSYSQDSVKFKQNGWV